MSNTDVFDLHTVIGIVRRRWWLIILCLLAAIAGAYIVSSRMPPVYTATTTLLVGPAQDLSTNESTAIYAGERLAFTYSQMLKANSVLESAISQLNLDESVDELVKRINTEPVSNTQLILLTVSGPSPDEDALLANTIAKIFTEQTQSLYTERYVTPLNELNDKMSVSSDLIEETQLQIDDLRSKKIEKDAELTQLNNLLVDYREDNRLLKQDAQSQELTITRLRGSVSIADEAVVSTDQVTPPYTAVIKLVVDTSVTGAFDYVTYSQMLIGLPILQAALDELKMTESPDALLEMVKAEPIKDSSLIQLSVTDADSTRAKQLASTIAKVFVQQIQTLLTQFYVDRLVGIQQQINESTVLIDQTQAEIKTLTVDKVTIESNLADLENQQIEYRSDYRVLQQDYDNLNQTAANAADTVIIAEPAQVPFTPEDHLIRDIALAGMGGILLGAALVFLWEYLNDKIRTPQDVQETLDIHTLGMISRLTKGEEELVLKAKPQSYVAETFRMLGNSIQFSKQNASIKTLLITSPSGLEGKSYITANLAVALANAGKRVVIIDADLHRPRQHILFGLKQGMGLYESLSKGTSDGRLKSTRIANLQLLTCGRIPKRPVHQIDSPQFSALLEEISQNTNYVLVDSPPVIPVADASLLAPFVDGVLMVIRAERTTRQNARHALNSLQRVNANMIGVVLNDVEVIKHSYSSYYVNKQEKRTKKIIAKKWSSKKSPQADTLNQETQISESINSPEKDTGKEFTSVIQWGKQKE